MKNILIVCLLIFAVELSYSDQLAWITKAQAEKTIAYFEDNDITRVVLWCACCDNDPKTLINVTKIYYKPSDDPSYYEVYIEGTNPLVGQVVSQPVDLAYVHIKRNSKWRCLGKELKFECDPCTKAFKF
ncbi:MAG TPA: hypothetical protein VGK25_10305 [Ignavibacteria bacterium]|jgi:hypothetical protein